MARMVARPRIRCWQFLLLAAGLALGGVRAGSAAPAPRWERLGPPVTYRSDTPVTYDTKRNRALALMPPYENLANSSPESSAELWATTGEQQVRWVHLGAGPPVHDTGPFIGIQYEPSRDRLWAFSGSYSQAASFYPGRVWTLDLDQEPLAWVERPVTGGAPHWIFLLGVPLEDLTFVFDTKRDRVITLGGKALSLSDTPGWSYLDIATTGRFPPSQSDRVATYDPWRDRLVIYGGYRYDYGNPVTYYDETWALSLSDAQPEWKFLTPRRRVAYARAAPSAALDRRRGRWIVTGGRPSSDTWALDLSPDAPADSATWIAIDPGRSDPADRPGSIVWADSVQDRVVRYGGITSDRLPMQTYVDSWSLSPGGTAGWQHLTRDSLQYGGAVTSVDPATGDLISVIDKAWKGVLDVRDGAASLAGHVLGPSPSLFEVASASDGERLLAFGGAPSADGKDANADLLAFPFSAPQSPVVLARGGPPPRSGAAAIFDAARRRFVIHGGRVVNPQGYSTALSDTWAWDVEARRWSRLADGDFPGHWGAMAAYDPVRDRFLVLGGRDTTSIPVDPSVVHVLPLAPGGTWETLPSMGSGPPFFYGATGSADYDPMGDRMLVVAHDDDHSAYHLTVWELSLQDPPTWSKLPMDGETPPQQYPSFVATFDPQRGHLVVMGSAPWILLGAMTPVPVALLSAVAAPDRVRIVWKAGGTTTATVERKVGEEPWLALGVLQAVDDEFALEDRDVRSSQSLRYRLAIASGTNEVRLGQVAVIVPEYSVRLAGTVPQPAIGNLTVSFTLPSNAAATLELIDVSGRRVQSRAVGELGRGTHTVRFEPTPPSGLYFLRLTQNGVSSIRRAVLIR